MEKGTLAYINYTLRVKGDEKVIDTTLEEEAKKSGIYDPSTRYKPMLVSVGERWVVQGLDEALLEMKEGEKRTVEVPPEKGYGQRDPSKIKLIPLRKFGENAGRLKVGDRVEIDGQIGTISYIGSGRVAVDFNHRLAGKTLVYDVEVVKVLKQPSEKVKALVANTLRVDEEKIDVKLRAGTATVTLPTDIPVEGGTYLKRAAASTVFRYVPEVRKLVFQEIFEAPAPEKKEEAKKEEKREEAEAQAKPSSSTSEQASS